jgi:transcriptional regulator with XRE-family HTH domain
MVSIGERITQLRKAKNWSQDELAKKIDSSRVMLASMSGVTIHSLSK